MTLETKPAPTIENWPEMPPIARRLWEARQAISDPAKWWDGRQVPAEDQRCMALAIQQGDAWSRAIHLLAIAVNGGPAIRHTIAYFNDTHTHAEVLAKMDEAIAAALAEGV